MTRLAFLPLFALLAACAPEPPEAASSLDCTLPSYSPPKDFSPGTYVVDIYREALEEEEPFDPIERTGDEVDLGETIDGETLSFGDGYSFFMSFSGITVEEGSQCPEQVEQGYDADLVPATDLPPPGLTFDVVDDEEVVGRFAGAWEDPYSGRVYVMEGAFSHQIEVFDTGLPQ